MVCFDHITTLFFGNLGNVLVPRTQSGAIGRTERFRSSWVVQQIPSRTILPGRDCSPHFDRKSQAGMEDFIHYYNTTNSSGEICGRTSDLRSVKIPLWITGLLSQA